MLLLALIGGAVTGVATDNVNVGLAVGGGIAFIALLVLYQQGKESRERVEKEIAQFPIEDKTYWLPVLDAPETISTKLRDRLAV